MDNHDGNVVQWYDGLCWYYSMSYQDCELAHGIIPPRECPGIYYPFGHCGFRTDHTLHVYTSPNLKDCTLVSEYAMDTYTKPYGIYFRPKLLNNAATGK